MCLSVCLSVCLTAYLPACLPACLSVCLSVCLPVCILPHEATLSVFSCFTDANLPTFSIIVDNQKVANLATQTVFVYVSKATSRGSAAKSTFEFNRLLLAQAKFKVGCCCIDSHLQLINSINQCFIYICSLQGDTRPRTHTKTSFICKINKQGS